MTALATSLKRSFTIGVDARHLLTAQPSGVGVSARALLEALIEQADPDRVSFRLFANAARQAVALPETFTDHPHVQVTDLRLPNRVLNASVFLTRRPYLDHLMRGVDVLWSPNVLFLSVSPRTPLALTVHDLSFLLLPETFSWKRRLWHQVVHATDQMRRAELLFAVSETTKRDLIEQLAISEKRIRVIPHGIPVVAAYEAMPAEWYLSSDMPFVLFLATLEPRKNVVTLIAAFERAVRTHALPHHLVLAGGWGWKSRAIREAVRRSSLVDRIHVLGYVSEEEKAWLLKRAAVLAFPSLYEGFGLPPLEAFRAGVPVVASSTSAVAETVGDAAVLTNPYDAHELAFALGNVLTDPFLREMLVVRGRARCERYAWKTSAASALEAFEMLASQSLVPSSF